MRHFIIDSSPAVNTLAVIRGSEAHHIKNVLRLTPGDRIKLFDGTGFEYEALIKKVSAEAVEVDVVKKDRTVTASGTRIVVAQAFLKEKKMDDMVRSLCELGVAQWIPFFSQRSIARPDATRLAGRIGRWNRIAAQAVKQCRRADIPEIGTALSFEEVLDFSTVCDLKIIFWENETDPLRPDMGLQPNRKPGKVLIMLGPEGGFAEREVDLARNSGFSVAGLGPRILRAETATLAACAIVQYLFGDMGQKNVDKK